MTARNLRKDISTHRRNSNRPEGRLPNLKDAASGNDIATFLEETYRRYHKPELLKHDPLEFARKYRRPVDQEVAGLVGALLAYGNVKSIRASVDRLLAAMGSSPERFVLDFRPHRAPASIKSFSHRWTTGADLIELFSRLQRVLKEHGSLEKSFHQAFENGGELREALSRFASGFRPSTSKFLVPNPGAGGACKRLNLFLRWMVRKDELDLGLWKGVSTAKLVMPLDTHVARIGRYLRLTSRKTTDWKMAEEITRSLACIDPEDPLRFDFALSHMGILKHCPPRVDPTKCRECALLPSCSHGYDGI